MDHKFKCCNKSFIHYVCINCNEVVHKYCASKLKKEIRFISENKIICCGSDDSPNEESAGDSTETLEKTIQELVEDKEMRDRHLQKIKKDSEMLVREATAREDELNELVMNQEAKIRQLRELIGELRLSLEVYTNKMTQAAGTQTVVDTKNVSTVTDNPQYVVAEHVRIDNTGIGCTDQQTMTEIMPEEATKDGQINGSRRLLILSDDYGRNVARLLSEKYNSCNFSVESIYKPGANYQQVIENLEGLCRGYTKADHVVVIAGSNNFTRTPKYPLFRNLCDKIKKCANLNLTLVNVPYKTKSGINQYIHKFNQKLSDFIARVNNYIPGRVEIIDVNGRVGGVSREELCREIMRATRNTRSSLSNLVFVETNVAGDTDRHGSGHSSVELIASGTSTVIVDLEREGDVSAVNPGFLYPRLSQLKMTD